MLWGNKGRRITLCLRVRVWQDTSSWEMVLKYANIESWSTSLSKSSSISSRVFPPVPSRASTACARSPTPLDWISAVIACSGIGGKEERSAGNKTHNYSKVFFKNKKVQLVNQGALYSFTKSPSSSSLGFNIIEQLWLLTFLMPCTKVSEDQSALRSRLGRTFSEAMGKPERSHKQMNPLSMKGERNVRSFTPSTPIITRNLRQEQLIHFWYCPQNLLGGPIVFFLLVLHWLGLFMISQNNHQRTQCISHCLHETLWEVSKSFFYTLHGPSAACIVEFVELLEIRCRKGTLRFAPKFTKLKPAVSPPKIAVSPGKTAVSKNGKMWCVKTISGTIPFHRVMPYHSLKETK